MVAFELVGNDSKESVFRLRLTRLEASRLNRLADALHKDKAEAVRMAIMHTLGTVLSEDKRLHVTVPGEPQVVRDQESA